jgi:hypothetical protein
MKSVHFLIFPRIYAAFDPEKAMLYGYLIQYKLHKKMREINFQEKHAVRSENNNSNILFFCFLSAVRCSSENTVTSLQFETKLKHRKIWLECLFSYISYI